MKMLLRSVLILLVLVKGFSLLSSSAHGAGNTSSDSNPGQVRTASQDGTLYLTTQVTADSQRPTENSTNSITAEESSTPNTITGFISQPMGFADNLGDYISSLLNIVIVICLLLVFLYFILAGFQWITSGGDKGKTEEARNKIVNAFVGILIVSSSFALASFVAYILGFESINEALGSIRQIDAS